jgi:DNA processing protein
LLRDGATLVRGAEDVIEALGTPAAAETAPARRPAAAPVPPAAAPAPLPQGGVEALILDRLGASPLDEDQLTRDLGRSAREVAQALAVLEMAGRVTRGPGGVASLAT